MGDERIETAEHILPGHPDKLCDAAVDAIVDFVHRRDPQGQCGLEAACVFDSIYLTGRIAASEQVLAELSECLQDLVRQTYASAGYGTDAAGYTWVPTPEDIRITTNFCYGTFEEGEREYRSLSDDQAICVGYANSRADTGQLPPAQALARRIGRELVRLRAEWGAGQVGPDAKALCRVAVTPDGWSPREVSVSLNHHVGSDWLLLRELAEEAVSAACAGKPVPIVHLNGAGMFVSGGPNGDNGLSGKKLVVDAYGPTVPIGGGAWSGKDFNKVDRMGGLLARELALRCVKTYQVREAQVTLSYFPGSDRPAGIEVLLDGRRNLVEERRLAADPALANATVTARYHDIGVPLPELALWGHQQEGLPWEGHRIAVERSRCSSRWPAYRGAN